MLVSDSVCLEATVVRERNKAFTEIHAKIDPTKVCSNFLLSTGHETTTNCLKLGFSLFRAIDAINTHYDIE